MTGKLLAAPISEDPTCQACSAETRLKWRYTKRLEQCAGCGGLFLTVELACETCHAIYAQAKLPLPRGIQA
jgi:hypothetical protein